MLINNNIISIKVNDEGEGYEANGYNKERTPCDILRAGSHVEIQVAAEVLKRYVKRQDRNIPLLSEYAVQFKVEKKLRSYLEVLL